MKHKVVYGVLGVFFVLVIWSYFSVGDVNPSVARWNRIYLLIQLGLLLSLAIVLTALLSINDSNSFWGRYVGRPIRRFGNFVSGADEEREREPEERPIAEADDDEKNSGVVQRLRQQGRLAERAQAKAKAVDKDPVASHAPQSSQDTRSSQGSHPSREPTTPPDGATD